MPIPEPIVTSIEEFKRRQATMRALQTNIKVQEQFCWWCGEYSQVLTWKYWHGFCSEACWREYRDSRLGTTANVDWEKEEPKKEPEAR